MSAISLYAFKMATSYERTALGERLAAVRKAKGFKSAQALADAIPAPSVTKATIVNIEAGRKSDPSILELMQIASALDVPPMSLVLDIENPFASMSGMGLAEPANSQMVVEYAVETNLFRRGSNVEGRRLRLASALLMGIKDLEWKMERYVWLLESQDEVELIVAQMNPEEHRLITLPSGRIWNAELDALDKRNGLEVVLRAAYSFQAMLNDRLRQGEVPFELYSSCAPMINALAEIERDDRGDTELGLTDVPPENSGK